MVTNKIIDSFNAAIEGIIYVLKTQRNMRFHFLAAALILILSVVLKMDWEDMVLLMTAIVVVLLTEMINTSIEHVTDLVKGSFHPLARIVKDVSAGAVLLASLYAVGVAYLVFFRRKYLLRPLEIGLSSIRSSEWHVAFVSLAVVVILTVIVKILFHRGSPLRGGMPSVHAALAFSVFALVALLPGTPALVVVLVFFLALVVAQGRLASRIHTFYEVISGSLWGMALTYFLYKLLSS
ncbi:MAG: diacylglycerol kinase [Candidatus Aureabacteria bacterium]|nr:diacylglycerol kinase [Candidatus Auribacterota bacterium]